MPRLTIDANNFLRGMSDTDYSQDGGYSSAGKKHVLDWVEGLLCPANDASDTGNLGASNVGIAALATTASAAYLLEDGGTAHLLPIAEGGTVGAVADTDDEANQFTRTVTDMIMYGGDLFISSLNDIAKGTVGSIDWDWFTSAPISQTFAHTANTLAHHFLDFNGNLFVTDKNTVRKWDGSTWSTVLTVPGDGVGIRTMIAHNNRVYLTTTNIGERVQTTRRHNIMYIWDGVNEDSTFENIITMPDDAYSLVSFRGVLVVFFWGWMAYWNGTRFEKIRTLDDSVSGYRVVRKNDIAQRKGVLYIRDGNSILAWDLKKFWYVATSATDIQMIHSLYTNDLGYTSSTNTYNVPLGSIGSNGIWYSKWQNFPMNAIIRSVQIVFGEDMASGDVNTIKLVDQEGDTLKTLTASYAAQGAVKAVEFRNINQRCSDLQIQISSFDNLIKRIIVEYDYTRQPIKK